MNYKELEATLMSQPWDNESFIISRNRWTQRTRDNQELIYKLTHSLILKTISKKMKIKITKNDFTENGGKLFLNYLDILNQWESDSVGKTLNILAEKIAKKLLIDHGFNDSDWSQQKHTLQQG